MGVPAENIRSALEDTAFIDAPAQTKVELVYLGNSDPALRIEAAQELYSLAKAHFARGEANQAAMAAQDALELIDGIHLVNGSAALPTELRDLISQIVRLGAVEVDGWPVTPGLEAANHADQQRRTESGQRFGSLHLLQNLRAIIIKQ
jgi:hypothetical protein